MKRPLLVDGTNVVMRYASAMQGAAHEDVLHSVVRCLRECAKEVGTLHVVVCLDGDREHNVRRGTFPEYKAGREVETHEWSKALAALPVLRCVEMHGYEADDCIATLAWRFWSRSKHKAKAAILSSDSDLLALADIADVYHFAKGEERINPYQGKKYRKFVLRDAGWVCEKYGIARPHLLTDLKALAGEPGDNVPGPWGKHTVAKAQKLLTEYGTALGVCNVCESLVPGDIPVIMRNLELLRLKTDLAIPSIEPYECLLQPL
jgi:5'-3' exonuclease